MARICRRSDACRRRALSGSALAADRVAEEAEGGVAEEDDVDGCEVWLVVGSAAEFGGRLDGESGEEDEDNDPDAVP